MLRLITAVVRPNKVEAVKSALRAEGVHGMTMTEAQGYGRQGGHSEIYRGEEYAVEFVPKVKIEVIVDADRSEAVIGTIVEVANSGKVGDGKIWVTEVVDTVRIRTAERGLEAV